MRKHDQIDINSSEIPVAPYRPPPASYISQQTQRKSRPRSRYWVPRQLRKDWLCFLVFLDIVVLSLLLVCAIGRSALPYYGETDCRPSNGTQNGTAPDCGSTAPLEPSYTVFQGWSPSSYFIGAYLPVMIATIMAALWKCVFQRIKEIEPYYRLSKPNGAEARESLLFHCSTDYLGIAPGSFSGEHLLLFIGSVNSLLLTIGTALASGVLYIAVDNEKCSVSLDPKTASNDCQPVLKNDSILASILCVPAVISLVLTAILFNIMRKRPLNLRMEAVSIGGIASLLQFSAGPNLDATDMQRFPNYRYALRDVADEKSLFKVIKLDEHTKDEDPKAPKGLKEPTQDLKMILAVLFCLYLTGVLILICIYRFTEPGPTNGFERFMDSRSLGIKVFMACIGIMVKMGWSSLASYVCQRAPYAALASSEGASAEESILLTTSCHPVTALNCRITWSNRAVAAASVSVVLSELLIILLPAIPFSTSVARTAFEASTALAIAILAIMISLLGICVLPTIFKWSILRSRDIPEPPRCIAETLALLQNLDTAARLAEVNALVGEERKNAIKGWNLRWRVIRSYDEKDRSSKGWQLVGDEPSSESKPMIVD